MGHIVRFGISLDKDLLEEFDQKLAQRQYGNRSEAIRDLIRDDFVKKQWQHDRRVAGAITLVYDHHRRQLLNHLMHIQHDHQPLILSTQHVHLDHHNCLEVIIVRGKSSAVQKLYWEIKSTKDVRHAGFAMATTGKGVV